MLVDNPLLHLLGRRGRGAIVDTLRRAPTRTWRVRDLATFAAVDAMTASRTVRELEALGAVEVKRPGRDARIRWRAESPAAAWLSSLAVPDLRLATGTTFAHAYVHPPGRVRVVLWRHPEDDPASALSPVRIGLIVSRDEEAALEAAGPALDAVQAAGLPTPELATFTRAHLDPADPVAAAVLGGTVL